MITGATVTCSRSISPAARNRDTVTPPPQAEELALLFGGAPVEWLADVGHIPHIEAPAAFMAALDRAIAPARGAATTLLEADGPGPPANR